MLLRNYLVINEKTPTVIVHVCTIHCSFIPCLITEFQNILPTNKDSTKTDEHVKIASRDDLNDAALETQLENGKSNKILLQVIPETHFEPRELERIIATETQDLAQLYGLSFHTRIFHGNFEVGSQETLKTTTEFSGEQHILSVNENVWKGKQLEVKLINISQRRCSRTKLK